MPRNRFFHCLTLAAAVFLLWETQASAYETRIITDHANTPLFQLPHKKTPLPRPWNIGRTSSGPERTTPCPPPSTWAP